LLEHPAVVDAAVIGIPVEKQTEIIKAFVQLKSTYSPSEKLSREILDYLSKHLESQKRPQELEFIRELPKTTTGKIRRSELKNREIEKRKGR
jgi:acyl-coenzyme A synthetase/AMP-(fatty) acid ligase